MQYTPPWTAKKERAMPQYIFFRVSFDDANLPPAEQHTLRYYGRYLVFLGEPGGNIAIQALAILKRPTVSRASWYREADEWQQALEQLRKQVGEISAVDQTATLVSVSR
jgi:hypothetical protein